MVPATVELNGLPFGYPSTGAPQADTCDQIAAIGTNSNGDEIYLGVSSIIDVGFSLAFVGTAGEEITFKYWDGYKEYDVQFVYTMVANAQIGAYDRPEVLALSSQFVCKPIPLVKGWQIISFLCIGLNSNGGFDMISTATWGQDDRILGRDGRLLTASYDGEKWQGSLVGEGLSQKKGYKVFFTGPAGSILEQSGSSQSPLENVVLTTGWNWIGHAAFRPYNVNSGVEVVSGVSPSESGSGSGESWSVDDLIKTRSGSSLSQCVFDGETFQGELTELNPGLGYEIFVKQALVFKYTTTISRALNEMEIFVYEDEERI